MSRYLKWDRYTVPGRRTPTVDVLGKRSGVCLGTIKWYAPWRQFCFFPTPATVFNVECMTDIQVKIGELKAERSRG